MNWSFLHDLKFADLPLEDRDKEVLQELATKLQNNYPYHSTEYAGQMIKPPHQLAQAAYWMATFVNPNNHALDGGRATSALELEVMAELGKMVGYEQSLGHLTSGGTVANLEALWVARQAHPGTTIVASALSHYTHSRMSEVLGLPFKAIAADSSGRMDVNQLTAFLERQKAQGKHTTVVATLGTTGIGSVDPLDQILPLKASFDFRIHVDSAYGGYFKLTELPRPQSLAYDSMSEADSIVIDPHKHGLQPYGCGAILLKNPQEGAYYKHDSPYTYFTSSELHLGEITLECSRAGASAAAAWATMRRFPLVPHGEMAQRLEASLHAAQGLIRSARAKGFLCLEPQLDICVFSNPGQSASQISQANRQFFERKAEEGIHLALLKIKKEQCPWDLHWDQEELVVVRSVLMKPEHNDPEFWSRLLA